MHDINLYHNIHYIFIIYFNLYSALISILCIVIAFYYNTIIYFLIDAPKKLFFDRIISFIIIIIIMCHFAKIYKTW